MGRASGRSGKRADTGDRGVTGEADHSDVDPEDPLRTQCDSRNCDADSESEADQRDPQRRREWHEAHQRELLAQYPTAPGRDGFQATRVVVTDIVDMLTDGIEIEGTAEVAINHR